MIIMPQQGGQPGDMGSGHAGAGEAKVPHGVVRPVRFGADVRHTQYVRFVVIIGRGAPRAVVGNIIQAQVGLH